jgi:hypothetical protein
MVEASSPPWSGLAYGHVGKGGCLDRLGVEHCGVPRVRNFLVDVSPRQCCRSTECSVEVSRHMRLELSAWQHERATSMRNLGSVLAGKHCGDEAPPGQCRTLFRWPHYRIRDESRIQYSKFNQQPACICTLLSVQVQVCNSTPFYQGNARQRWPAARGR